MGGGPENPSHTEFLNEVQSIHTREKSHEDPDETVIKKELL